MKNKIEIKNEIISKLPNKIKVTGSCYEGANVVLYTEDDDFLQNGGAIIRQLVNEFKKRIEVRAHSKLLAPADTVEEEIKKIVPNDAEITQVLLEPARSLVTLESKNPGRAIGKNGENLKKIKEKLKWTPIIKRDSAIRSKITENIREVLHADSKARKKFLNSVGERIYGAKRSGDVGEPWVRVTFMGGTRQVGRSCFLLQTPESNVMIDCGVNVGSEKYAYPQIKLPEFNLQDLDAVVISHAHLDHSGFLPYLFKYGYRGPVYCTEPTRDIIGLLLLDYTKVSALQGRKQIYGAEDVKETIKHTIPLEFGVVTDITPDIKLTLYNAGHILGSAMCHFHIGEGFHNFLYSGDYKVVDTMLLDGAHHTFPRVETFMTESTYGDPERTMPPMAQAEKELCDTVTKILDREGKVLVPVLGVGRAQDIMIILEEYFRKNKIKIPIYIDGMVWDIMALHTAYPNFLNSKIREKIFKKGENPFLSPIFKRIGSKKERDAAITGGPCVFLATSGMMVGGPSVYYFKHLAEDKKNGMIFVCYQGEGTLGRRLQSGESLIQLDGEHIEVKIERSTANISDHAYFNELMDYIRKVKPRPRKVVVVHGEKTRTIKLASSIHKEFKIETTSPKPVDSMRLR